ncbi:hypothetical protein WICMUC_004596 [Wickerhamomyces mucosus]|uniref:Bacterial surface antigen (D15) domain-containing protein n=1 Tax=Wickerhamomyces mucosus TaxID=1378264 RepID=A0A9P8TAC5_9ASCO|nr:hypothetical protein WICMUC_004596 [Wickerhamomyces mucosus]
MSSFGAKLHEETKYNVLNRQLTKPLLLNKLEVVGGDFSDKYYENLVEKLLPNQSDKLSNILSLQSLNDELLNIEKSLLYTGLFSNISIDLDLDEALTTPLLKSQSQYQGLIPVKAKFSLTQLPIFKYSSYSTSQDTGSGFGFRYLDPNFLKNSSSLLIDVNLNYDILSNTLNSKLWDLNILLPLAKLPTFRAIFNPSISLIDASEWSSHEQYNVGSFVGLQSTQLSQNNAIKIITGGISFTSRQVRQISNSASDSIRTFAGDDFKIGSQFNYKVDSRQLQGKFVKNGYLLDFTNEYAGSNSIDSFSKASNDSKKNIELYNFNKSIFKFDLSKSFIKDIFTANFNFETGHIIDFSNNRLHILDKFFLGGNESLKGFNLNSVGLKDGNDSIGGTSVFRANFQLFSRIPNISKDSPLRLYNFFNIGDNFNFSSFNQFTNLFTSGDIINKSASAVGVGILYKANNATFDLSYNVPLSARVQESSKPGFSISATLNFF